MAFALEKAGQQGGLEYISSHAASFVEMPYQPGHKAYMALAASEAIKAFVIKV